MVPKKIFFGILMSILVSATFAYAGTVMIDEARNYFNEGLKAQTGGDLGRAMTSYQKALLIDPADEMGFKKRILNNVAVMYGKTGDTEKAIEIFEQILAFDPEDKLANFNMGFIFNRNGERCKALEYWIRAINEPKDFLLAEEPKEEKKK